MKKTRPFKTNDVCLQKKLVALLCFLIMLFGAAAQSKTDDQPDSTTVQHFSFNGYLKDLSSFTFPVKAMPFHYANLIHNRLNAKWQSDHFNASAELRNRMLWNGHPDPSLYTRLERGWIEYKSALWSIKAGRQRINWGMNNAWNPNDVFNAYNMFDFDYEERSGVDGLRVHYQKTEMSAIEFAATKGKDWNQINGAIKYNFNRSTYDWQLIAGIHDQRLTLGIGWQGSIGETGFKGEAQYFSNHSNSGKILNVSTEFDYITKNGWYLQGGLLFNQKGMAAPPASWSTLSFQNKPDNLMPTRWNILTGVSKEISSIVNGRITSVYSPKNNLIVLFPSISFSMLPNLDLDIFWQTFLASSSGKISPVNHGGFIRGRWSF